MVIMRKLTASEEIEKSRSLGSDTSQNPRLAMVASFIMEPKV